MVTVQTTAAAAGGARAASAWFDWVVLAASAWLVGGALLDGWAHIHIALLDTFFTPWHGVLYSGFAACAAVLGAGWVRGRTFRDWSLPNAYGCLGGCILFAVGAEPGPCGSRPGA